MMPANLGKRAAMGVAEGVEFRPSGVELLQPYSSLCRGGIFIDNPHLLARDEFRPDRS